MLPDRCVDGHTMAAARATHVVPRRREKDSAPGCALDYLDLFEEEAASGQL